MVVFDTTTLVLTITPSASPPIDPATQKPVTKCKQRLDHLLDSLTKAKTSILIPTPVLAEFLVKAGKNKDAYLDEFLRSRNFDIGPFDQRAAIECAYLIDGDTKANRKIDPTQTKAKVKFDRQIISIAKARGATCIYTDDEALAKCARENGIEAVMTWDIPLPPEPPIRDMFRDEDEP